MNTIYELSDATSTTYLAQRLAQKYYNIPALILLSGELGAGKTTFAQGFIKTLVAQTAMSPSYSYMNIHDGTPPIFHFDLYRIEALEELEELGLWEHLLDSQALRLVEWPERVPDLQKYADMHVLLSIKSNEREAHVTYFKSLPRIA